MSQAGSLGGGIIPPGGVVETLTGNTGGPVGPNGSGNINVVGDGITIDVSGNPGTNTLTISSLASSVAFSAYLSATESNVTGDGTTFQVPYDSTYFNNGAAFDTTGSVFIAPQDGEYCFSVNMFLEDIDVLATSGQVDLNVNSGGAIHNITNWNVSTVGDINGESLLNGFRILSLSANDTVGVQVTVSNTTLTIDVNGGALTDCVFEGFLVASVGGGANLTFDADTGSAVPAANVINVFGNGSNVTTSAAGNTITIDADGFVWNEITVVGPTAMAVENGYIANNVALVTLTLPAIATVGDIIRVEGKGSGLWTIAQQAGQSIRIGDSSTTVGVGGSLTATDAGDGVGLLCITANTGWMVTGGTGTIDWV